MLTHDRPLTRVGTVGGHVLRRVHDPFPTPSLTRPTVYTLTCVQTVGLLWAVSEDTEVGMIS